MRIVVVAPVAVCMLSEEALNLFGLTDDHAELDFPSFLTLLHRMDRGPTFRAFDSARMQAGRLDIRVWAVRPDGELRQLWLRADPEIAPDGMLDAFVGAILDVTDETPAAA